MSIGPSAGTAVETLPGVMLHMCTDQVQWLAQIAAWLRTGIEEAIALRGAAHVALAGGNTPAPLYHSLSALALPWEKIHWWIGDERCVPPGDAQSNERMIRENFSANGMPHAFHLHSWHGEPADEKKALADPDAAAAAYEQRLRVLLGEAPTLDVALLGLGADGHTASLFPESPALEEKTRLCVANPVASLNTTRWTMTYPLLDRAQSIGFLIRGQDKSRRVQQLAAGDPFIPAGRIHGPKISIWWLEQ